MERVFGYFLCTVSLLVMIVSGPCTGIYIFVVVQAAISQANLKALAGGLAMALIFGGIPFAVSYLVFKAGRKLIRDNSPPPSIPHDPN